MELAVGARPGTGLLGGAGARGPEGVPRGRPAVACVDAPTPIRGFASSLVPASRPLAGRTIDAEVRAAGVSPSLSPAPLVSPPSAGGSVVATRESSGAIGLSKGRESGATACVTDGTTRDALGVREVLGRAGSEGRLPAGADVVIATGDAGPPTRNSAAPAGCENRDITTRRASERPALARRAHTTRRALRPPILGGPSHARAITS